jgi:hypothetical protein
MLVDYEDVRSGIRESWKRDHHLLGFVIWRPFHNERHFNSCLGSILTEFDCRDDLGDYGSLETDKDDAETEVMAEIIDVVVAKEFPHVNENNVLVRMAIHFMTVELVKKLHEAQEGLSPRTKVERWLGQYKAVVE